MLLFVFRADGGAGGGKCTERLQSFLTTTGPPPKVCHVWTRVKANLKLGKPKAEACSYFEPLRKNKPFFFGSKVCAPVCVLLEVFLRAPRRDQDGAGAPLRRTTAGEHA